MKKYQASSINKTMSCIALGTDGFGVTKSATAAEELLDAYVEMGGNVIDCARMYGRPEAGVYGICEKVVGDWLARRTDRKRLVISTKGGFPAQDGRRRLDRGSLMSDMHESIEALRTDSIDIWWLHRDDPDRPVGEIMETLNAMIETGCIGCVGASNWSVGRIREAQEYAAAHGLHGFAGNQPQWSLARQVVNLDPTLQIMDSEMYEMHCKTGMLCMAFSSQAKGYFSKLIANGEDALSPKAKARFHFPENIAVAETLKAMCAELGCSPAALSLAWLANQPFATVAIISASRLSQLQDSMTALHIELAAEQVDRLRVMR